MFKHLILLFFLLPLSAQTWQAKELALTGNGNSFTNMSGHSWADIDGDGDPDLITFGSPRLWINRVSENGTFENGSALLPNLPSLTSGWAATFGDFDNDGDADVYLGASGRDYLLRNRFPLAFEEVGEAYALFDPRWCQSINWVDYNKDGRLDIYITHEVPDEDGPHHFYESAYPAPFIPRFPADGEPDTFGLADKNSHAYGLTWADVDIDGDLDAVTSACGSSSTIPNQNPHNKLYRNNFPDANFTDVTISSGIGSTPESSSGSSSYWATLFDYDGDAYPDLFIGQNSGNHRLWRNQALPPVQIGYELVPASQHNLDGNGAFLEGAVAGDYDNDGDLDIYITNAGLYDNDGMGSFIHRPGVIPIGDRDASWVDYDMDGHLDLFCFWDLYRNPGTDGNHWISLELIGDPSKGTTRNAHGVKIRLTAGGKQYYREHRFMVGTYSQHLLPTHFGLGTVDQVEEIQITWPNGDTSTYSGLNAVDQYLTIAQTGGCNGLRLVAQSQIATCAGTAVDLAGVTKNGNAQWSILAGPSRDRNQFSDPDSADSQFTPSLPGRYLLALNLPGCYDESVTVELVDSDIDENGAYELNDLLQSLPFWRQDFEFDPDQDGTFTVTDAIQFCQ